MGSVFIFLAAIVSYAAYEVEKSKMKEDGR